MLLMPIFTIMKASGATVDIITLSLTLKLALSMLEALLFLYMMTNKLWLRLCFLCVGWWAELDKLSSHFQLLSGLKAPTRSSLLQHLTTAMKEREALSLLDSVVRSPKSLKNHFNVFIKIFFFFKGLYFMCVFMDVLALSLSLSRCTTVTGPLWTVLR